MSTAKFVWIVFFFVLVVASSSIGFFFYSTVGNGLTRVVVHYLIRDLPNKQYSWRDFTDQGTPNKISGFYSSGDKDGFSL